MLRRSALALLVLSSLTACPKGAVPAPDAGVKVGVQKDVVATVNGTSITRFEVLLRTRTAPPQAGEGQDEVKRRALENIVLDELYAQKAVALGFETDSSFLEEMARVEAQVAEARRRELAKVYLHREVLQKVAVSDAEARAHFDAFPVRFGNQWRVAQVVVKGKAAADAVQADLAKGRSFEEVAAEKVGVAPPGEKPWELPAMAWAQVPPAWWPALDALEPGQVSPAIALANDRWVFVQLLERTPSPADFEALKPLIQAQLKSEKIDATRKATEAELRGAAKIEVGFQPEADLPPTP
ncbi:MAG: peptidyl-prolyl cis-trans isomerase [Myxococcales bacterium]|nr:peptidyl-prolyl cis-trans isomerase [Myxococcales bacterium]